MIENDKYTTVRKLLSTSHNNGKLLISFEGDFEVALGAIDSNPENISYNYTPTPNIPSAGSFDLIDGERYKITMEKL